MCNHHARKHLQVVLSVRCTYYILLSGLGSFGSVCFCFCHFPAKMQTTRKVTGSRRHRSFREASASTWPAPNRMWVLYIGVWQGLHRHYVMSRTHERSTACWLHLPVRQEPQITVQSTVVLVHRKPTSILRLGRPQCLSRICPCKSSSCADRSSTAWA